MNTIKKHFRDPVSSLSHLFGAVAAVPVTVALVLAASPRESAVATISVVIFGLSLFLLYTASAAYHASTDAKRTKSLRKVDHMMIFILIAGTYTPICLLTLKGAVGYALLCVIWSFAAAGVILTGIWLKAPAWLSSVIYVVMGWTVVFAFFPLIKALPKGGVTPLLVGGVLYSVGAVLYAFGKSRKFPQIPLKEWGWHEIFHMFTLAGSVCHIVFVFRYVVCVV